MSSDLLSQLSQTGLLGLLLAIAIAGYIKKDQEAKDNKKQFLDYLLEKGERDGEMKSQLINLMQNISNLLTQIKP